MITDKMSRMIEWYNNEFKLSDLYMAMMVTTEGSPYHRERTVAVHNDMVVMNYVGMFRPSEGDKYIRGMFAAIFHDVGKPGAMETKWKESRGDYNSFNGHEKLSARLWEDYAVANWDRMVELGLVPQDIYTIGWLIENHRPWGIKKPAKLQLLADTLSHTHTLNEFIAFTSADNWGRISDDWITARETIKEFHLKLTELIVDSFTNPHKRQPKGGKVLTIPVGTSGSGKTTYRNQLCRLGLDIFSLDDLREEFYGDDSLTGDEFYSAIYEASKDDSTFKSRANARYIEMVKKGGDIFLDNMNISKKGRAFFITEAKRHGYYVQAVLFPITIKEALDRQETRTDKNVPAHAVTGAYFSISLPSIGEVDEVIVYPGNL